MNQLTPLLDGICYLYKGKDIIRKGVCSIRKGVCLEEVPVRQEPTRPFYNCLRLVQAGINPIINTWLINSNKPVNARYVFGPNYDPSFFRPVSSTSSVPAR